METFPTTTTHLVALLVVVLGDRHNSFALPLDQAPRILQMMASTKRLDVQAGPSTRNTSSAPQMLSEPDRTYRAREAEAVYMECSVSAWPPATILWFRNDRSLKVEGERYQIFENGTLRILDLRREDSDTYTCFATNNLNNALLRAHLSVEVVWDEEGDEDDWEEYEEEGDEEEEGQDDGEEASASSPSAPNAGSGRGGGADEGEGELSATSPAAATAAAAATTSAGRAAATSEASCRLAGAAWSTALLLTLVPPLAGGEWHRGGL